MSSWWVRWKGLRNRTHFLRSTSTERSTPSTLSLVEQPPWPSSRMRLTRSFPSSCAQKIHWNIASSKTTEYLFLRWSNFKCASVHFECLLCFFGTIATLVTLTSWKAKQDFVSGCLQGRSLCLAWKLFSIFTNLLKSVCLHIHCPHRHSLLNNGDALASHRAWRVDKVSSCPIANHWSSHGRTFVWPGIWGQRFSSLISVTKDFVLRQVFMPRQVECLCIDVEWTGAGVVWHLQVFDTGAILSIPDALRDITGWGGVSRRRHTCESARMLSWVKYILEASSRMWSTGLCNEHWRINSGTQDEACPAASRE